MAVTDRTAYAGDGHPAGDRMRIIDVANAEWVSDPESAPLDFTGGGVTKLAINGHEYRRRRRSR